MKTRMAIAGAALGILLACAVAALNERSVVRIPFRGNHGLFSNIVVPMIFSRCYPQYAIACDGWPSDVAALMHGLPMARGREAKIELPREGDSCYIAQSPVVLASTSFNFTRTVLHAMVAPGGMFAPAEHVRALARSWWKSELGDARFVVGIHGRAAMLYDKSSLDFDTHMRLLGDEAAEEMRIPGARVMLASCNASIVGYLRARFGAALAWREPEGDINTGNVDWGGATQHVTAQIAKGALIDALLLSMCDVVVCGSSNVILYAAALRPAMRIRVARHLADARSG